MTREAVHFRSRAKDDVDEQAFYLAAEARDVGVGYAFLDAVEGTAARLAEQPLIGTARPFLNKRLPDLRFFRVHGFPRHLIFYRQTERGIDVIRVLHGARDVGAIFDSDDSL